jgi:outer membrane receptor protein involved in Fe transport
MRRWFTLICLILFAFRLHAGTTGKIAGTVADKETGNPLPGANIMVSGMTLGSAADLNGQFSILNVPPGTCALKVSMMGYQAVTVTDVRVFIDQTTRVHVDLEMEAIEGEVVTVVAEKSIIKEDVATSMTAVSGREIQELPVSSVENVATLQAGIQGGLQIRGGGADEALLLVDGITLRDPRNNNPVSSIALSAVKEISIERGGFNPEYGQVRSGVVKTVTREGDRSSYYGSAEFKYSPPAAKHFGISPFDRNSNWLRPYFDDTVCWTGTDNRRWSEYQQLQYPYFEGWNKVSQRLMTDGNPDNDLSPLAAQRVYMWETRKQPALDQPDYNIDAGFGGPVPAIGKKLGGLRFFTSFRRYREMLVVPLTRDDYVDYDWTAKINSDITPAMKLEISGLGGKQFTMQQNWSYGYLRYPSVIAGVMGDRPGALFGTGEYSLTDIAHRGASAKLTHVLGKNTFYEISLEHLQRKYQSYPAAYRNQEKQYEVVPGYFVDEAPFGYHPDDEVGIVGMLFGGFTSKRRDNTRVHVTTLKGDLSSQVDANNLVKTGVEFSYNDLNFDYGILSNYTDKRYDERVRLHVFPLRMALYAQDKLETKGFIMTAGLRMDYSNSNTDWWDVDPYDIYFFTAKYDESRDFARKASKGQWQISPRLSISHPITENSKLFFNYGHFKQMPSYETLFRVARSTDRRLGQFGDPNLVLAKTISYELGYDHAFFNDYLIQMAAFYHDIADQTNTTQYSSVGGIVYNRTTSNSYEDIRGFELTLRKNRGRWWTFFGNYTYQVSTSGHFGKGEIYQDPLKQKQYDEATVKLYQERPIPTPYARLNLSLYTPDDFGPKWGSFRPLGGYLANLLINWQAGPWVTWNPKGITSVANNVQQTDIFNAILRLSRTVALKKFRIQAFVDIENLFNTRRMSLANFGGRSNDGELYYNSLHLPESNAYDNIPGDDKIGSYRREGVEYQPMFGRGSINYETDRGNEGVIYYDRNTGRYVEFKNEAWADVEKSRLDRVLEDKAYIDMPNQDSFTFFDPRQIFLGIRISMDLSSL